MIGEIEQQYVKEQNVQDVTFGEIMGSMFYPENIVTIVTSQSVLNAALMVDCDRDPDMIPFLMKQEEHEWTPVWTRKDL